MGRVLRTRSSRNDYAEIWDFIAERASPETADRLLRSFDSAVLMLSENPKAGPERPELRPKLRSFPVGTYLIFYRPIRGGIELIRVLHGARDLRRVLRQR